MYREIKALAEREDRTLQGQVRHLLKLGIAVEEEIDAKEKKSGKVRRQLPKRTELRVP
jgi:hypothetical protein